jgi:hypothetical protein
MKYKLQSHWKETETETDENGNYSVDIVLVVESADEFLAGANVKKTITVVSNNDQTGHEVDAQRQKEIEDYCTLNDILISE